MGIRAILALPASSAGVRRADRARRRAAGDQRAGLEALLEAHRYTHGLDFIPQGTPTNATETAAPGALPRAARPRRAARRRARRRGRRRGARGRRRGRPLPDGGADAAQLALGLGPRQRARPRAANADLAELAPRRGDEPRAVAGARSATTSTPHAGGVAGARRPGWLRDWSHPLRARRRAAADAAVGAQPYGLLPVSPHRVAAGPGRPRRARQQAVLGLLRDLGRPLAGVPRLDPETPATAAPGAGERAALVSQILGAVPHPTGFAAAARRRQARRRLHDPAAWQTSASAACPRRPRPAHGTPTATTS